MDAHFTLIMAPVIWSFVLRDYQKNRIIVFCGQGNQKKEGYQIEQASIAIGSGGLWAKGYLMELKSGSAFYQKAELTSSLRSAVKNGGFAWSIELSFLLLVVVFDDHFY